MTLTDEDRALIERVLKGDAADAIFEDVFTLEEVAALLSAARDEGRAEGLGRWEPIETAPTDGTWVDLWVAGKEDEIPNDANCRRIVGRWWKSRGDEPSGWHIGLGPPPEGYAVSHWRPLPAPPASQIKEG